MANTTLISLSDAQMQQEPSEQDSQGTIDMDQGRGPKGGLSGTSSGSTGKLPQQRVVVDSSATRAIAERNSNTNDGYRH